MSVRCLIDSMSGLYGDAIKIYFGVLGINS